MTTAFCTVVTSTYIPYLKVMLHSMWVNSGLADGSRPMYVFTNDSVDYKMKAELKMLYPHINFMTVDVEKWTKKKKADPKYWALHAFGKLGQSEFDQVIFLDSDLVFIKPVTELLEMDMDLGMVRENSRSCFNSGLMVIGKKFRRPGMLEKLMNITKVRGEFGHDQWIVNDAFKDQITNVHPEFNALIPEVDAIGKPRVKVLHFIYKPIDKSQRIRCPAWCLIHYDHMAAEAERKIHASQRFDANFQQA